MNPRIPLAMLGGVLAGCSQYVVSPPAQFMPHEAPAPLPEGERALDFEGGHGGLWFAPAVSGGAVRYRQGLAKDWEVQGELGTMVVNTSRAETETFPAIFFGRFGAKNRFWKDIPHLSWTTGIGVGGSAGGAYLAPDIGVVAGYENAFVTPYLDLSASVSVPVISKGVDISDYGVDPADFQYVVDRPRTTAIGRALLGVRVGRETVSFSAGVGGVYLIESNEHGFFGASGTLSVRL